MRLTARVRAVSETDRVPPYITTSQVCSRLSSEPDLSEWSTIRACELLDRAESSTPDPPDYKLLAPVSPRYSILPRDEEGSEALPEYCPSIYKDGLLGRKMELSTPFTAATSRSWAQVWVELNNTQLNVYEVRQGGQKRGRRIGSYTLQYGDVGLANDYVKRPNVVRVRVEGEQFLLECGSQEDCIVWINVLQMAMDLALPLEERKIPKYRSIPRRGRRRHGGARRRGMRPTSDVYSNATTLQEIKQNPNMNRFSRFLHSLSHQYQLPGLGRKLSSASSASTDSSDNTLCPSLTIASSYTAGGLEHFRRNSSVCNVHSVVSTTNDDDDDDEIDGNREEDDRDDADAMDNSLFLHDTAATSFNTENSKWDPGSTAPSYESFLRYAQRCLVSLPQQTPWINKPVVMKGRKYIVRENYFEHPSDPNVPINAI
ncbi:hypothetical protein TRICI_006653 [Trichomonascus ciferrii]|uniref:PH domain-containing protein n=1 Tax=Trichomonascus ciferrii TaxID=44093 RepID=A0A642UEX1_9ASCO|nr:hypothetical protein TRICI_006653 [Trichomonascus ciferrii]